MLSNQIMRLPGTTFYNITSSYLYSYCFNSAAAPTALFSAFDPLANPSVIVVILIKKGRKCSEKLEYFLLRDLYRVN